MPELNSQSDDYEQDDFERDVGINDIPQNLLMSEVPPIPNE